MWLWMLTVVLLIPFTTTRDGDSIQETMMAYTCPANTTSPTTAPLVTAPQDGALAWVYALNEVFMEGVVASRGWAALLGKGGKISDLSPQTAVSHFMGYLIMAVIGLGFVLLVPISGCLFCCCRCCCCCCCKKKQTPSVVKRTACGICFITFLSMLILALIFSLLAASFVAAQFLSQGMARTLEQSLQAVDRFADHTSADLVRFKDDKVQPTLGEIQRQLIVLPQNTHKDLGESSGAEALYRELEEYTAGLNDSLTDLRNMDVLSKELMENETKLNNSIVKFKTEMTAAVALCTGTGCDKIKNKTRDLTVDLDFLPVVNYTQNTSLVMNQTLYSEANITISVEVGRRVWDGLGELIANSSHDSMEEVSQQINTVSTNLDDFVSQTAGMIDDINTDKLVNGTLGTLGENLNRVAPYVLVALLALCALPLLIAFCYTNGVLFGCCGGPPGKGAGFCNRGKGATCLMCGVSCTFLLTWIVMLVVTLLFLVGTLTHNELCRHLVHPRQSKDMKYINDLLNDQLNMNTSVDIFAGIDSCAQNQAMYTAFRVDQLFPQLNVTKLVDLSQFDFDALLDGLTDVNLTDGNIILMNNVTETHLTALDSAFQKVDFSKYDTALSKKITSMDLTQYSDDVKRLAEGTTVKDDVLKVLKSIDKINGGDVPIIQQTMDKLRETTNNAKSFVNSFNITAFLPQMKEAQDCLDDEALKQSLRNMATSIYKEIEKMPGQVESSVRCDIGRCQPLSDGLSGLVSTFCVYLLHPVNALWFGLGWCLLTLVIPMLCLAVSLVDQYRACEVSPYDDGYAYPLQDVPLKEGGGVPPKNKIYPARKV